MNEINNYDLQYVHKNTGICRQVQSPQEQEYSQGNQNVHSFSSFFFF